jgi:hypothetical protein
LAITKEGYTKKPADLMSAYQYLAFYYYNSNNEKETMEWVNKILAQEPGNEFANQIKDYYNKLKTSKPTGTSKTNGTKKPK